MFRRTSPVGKIQIILHRYKNNELISSEEENVISETYENTVKKMLSASIGSIDIQMLDELAIIPDIFNKMADNKLLRHKLFNETKINAQVADAFLSSRLLSRVHDGLYKPLMLIDILVAHLDQPGFISQYLIARNESFSLESLADSSKKAFFTLASYPAILLAGLGTTFTYKSIKTKLDDATIDALFKTNLK